MTRSATKIGDILFVNSSSKPCKYVKIGQKITDSGIVNTFCDFLMNRSISNKHNYCHVAICIFPNIFVEVAPQGGVSCRHINDMVINPDSAALLRPQKSYDEISFINYHINNIAQPYIPDFHSDLDHSNYCSKYVVDTLKEFDHLSTEELNTNTSPLDLHRFLSAHPKWEALNIHSINLKEVFLQNDHFETLAHDIRISQIYSQDDSTNSNIVGSLDGFQDAKTFSGRLYTFIYEAIKTTSPLVLLSKDIYMAILSPKENLKKLTKACLNTTILEVSTALIKLPRSIYTPSNSVNEMYLSIQHQAMQKENQTDKRNRQKQEEENDRLKKLQELQKTHEIECIWLKKIDEGQKLYLKNYITEIHLINDTIKRQQALKNIHKLNQIDDFLFQITEKKDEFNNGIRDAIGKEKEVYARFMKSCEVSIYCNFSSLYERDRNHSESNNKIIYRRQLLLHIINIDSFLKNKTILFHEKSFLKLRETIYSLYNEIS